MDLVFLHGPPAAGKLTIAKALLAHLTNARLLDNHATIDLALMIMPFNAPGFWDLVGDLRLRLLEAAAQTDLTYLVTTACYGHPEDLPVVEAWEAVLHRHAARLVPIHIACPTAALEQRVGAPDRVTRGKLTSIDGLRDHLARNDYAPLPRPGGLSIDTSLHDPVASASLILRHLTARAKP